MRMVDDSTTKSKFIKRQNFSDTIPPTARSNLRLRCSECLRYSWWCDCGSGLIMVNLQLKHLSVLYPQRVIEVVERISLIIVKVCSRRKLRYSTMHHINLFADLLATRL